MSSKKNPSKGSGKGIASKKSSFMSSFYRPGYSEKNQGVNRHNFDDEEEEEGEPNTAQQGDNKIKFKKKRKKPKIGLVSVYKDMTYKSRFEDWTREQLSQVLVDDGVEVAPNMWKQELVELCDAMFAGREMPPQPKSYSLDEMIILRKAVLRIQRAYRRRREMKLLNAEYDLVEKQQDMLKQFEATNEIGFGRDELMYMTAQLDVREVDLSASSSKKHKKKGTDTTVTHTNASILDMEYHRPIPEKAEAYAHYYMPRKDAKKGLYYDFWRTTTGRHCSASRNGEETCCIMMAEQLDAFEEGSVSELEKYGMGVVNYFKFLKWGIWLFILLTAFAMPSIVFNTNGVYSSHNTGFDSLAKTTIGNLLPNSTSDRVHIPGCYGYEELHMQCYLTRYTLAKFYTAIDVLICLIIAFALLWLRVFEQREEIVLRDTKYDVSMYTVVFANLPHSTKHYDHMELPEENGMTDEEKVEEVIREHIAKVLKKKVHISDVIVAFNNEDEIRLSVERGDHIKEKTRLVNEFRAHQSIDDTEEQREAKLNALKAQCHRIDTRLKSIKDEFEVLGKRPVQVLQAYVTFRSLEDRDEILKVYNQLPLLMRWCGMNRGHLKIRNKMPQVYSASDPKIILWENLHFTALNRIWRRFWSTLLASCWIVISLVVVFGAKYLQEKGRETGNKEDEAGAAVWCVIAAMIVVLMNVMIELTLRKLDNYEKHQSDDNRNKSMVLRLFVLQFCNTSIIFLFDNSANLLHSFGIEVEGGHLEFTADWFNTMGVTIIIVHMCNIVFAHTYKAVQFYSFIKRRRSLIEHSNEILTQNEMNRAFVGPELDYSANYGQMLATIFSCLAFSTGIPLLYPITAVYFTVYYFVEKYLFIHMYRIPENFKAASGMKVTSWIPLAVVIHLWSALWMLTNTEIFINPPLNQTSTDKIPNGRFSHMIHTKITGKIGVPLFSLFIIWLFFRILQFFMRRFYSEIMEYFRSCCPSLFSIPILKDRDNRTYIYEEAKLAGKLIGLENYNILQNPKYREAFAITDDFASKHRSVRTVKNTNGESMFNIKKPAAPVAPVVPAARPKSVPAAGVRTITLTDTVSSQQYSTSLQYNPYSPAAQDEYYYGATQQRFTYQQTNNVYGHNADPYGYNNGSSGYPSDPYGYNRPQTTTDSFYARQLAASDTYNAGPRPNTNNDSYYARQVADEYKSLDYAAPGYEWGYEDYATPSRPINRNGTKHQSLDRNTHSNQSFILGGAYDDGGYSNGSTPTVTQQPGPPKKSVGITEPVRDSPAPSTTTSNAADAKKNKKVHKKSSNLGFSKSFYAGDESFYAVEQEHED